MSKCIQQRSIVVLSSVIFFRPGEFKGVIRVVLSMRNTRSFKTNFIPNITKAEAPPV